MFGIRQVAIRARHHIALRFSSSPVLVSCEEAQTLVGNKDVRFVDIRDPRVFSKGHIEGAANMIEFFTYLAMSDEKGVAHLMKTFEKVIRSKGINGDERVITYEDGLRGMYGASCRGWYLLKLLGVENVQVMEGGWNAWKQENRPFVKGEERLLVPTESTFTAQWSPKYWSDLRDVQEQLEGENPAKLLDVRDQVEWDGHSSSPYGVDFAPRKGRLPGAIHIEWYQFMETVDESEDIGEDNVSHFKSPEAIREIMKRKGFTDLDEPIMVYCFKGARASNTLTALLSAGFTNVTNYFGSWNEWSRHKSLTIDADKYGSAPKAEEEEEEEVAASA